MSDPFKILVRAHELGLRLTIEGQSIAIRPGRGCPTDLLADIRKHKTALLDLLQAESARLGADEAPWLHIAQQVIDREFDGGERSVLESLWIGLRNFAHPRCREAKQRLESMLEQRRKEARR